VATKSEQRRVYLPLKPHERNGLETRSNERLSSTNQAELTGAISSMVI